MLRFDPTELSRYGGLTLYARGIVEGVLAGIHRSPLKGFSVEFAEHRPYSPGDEVRRIDWRAYGKTDRYYVKEFEDETNLTAYLIVDGSGSMRYRGKIASVSKFEYAQRVAASFAYLLLAQHDAVGLILHNTGTHTHIPAKASSKQVIALLRALEQAQPGGETSVGQIWETIAHRDLPRRGLAILISDGFDDVSRLQSALRRIRHRGQEIIFLQILAPEELDFPFTKATRFRDFENPSRVVPMQNAREQYKAAWDDWMAGLKKALGDVHADLLQIRTDEPVDRALGRYLARRADRR